MNTTAMRVGGTGLFFLFIFVSGIWLSRSGRPLNGNILAVHKLVSVAAGVFLIITMVRLNRVAPLSATEWTAIVATGLCFLGTVVSGGLVTTQAAPWKAEGMKGFPVRASWIASITFRPCLRTVEM